VIPVQTAVPCHSLAVLVAVASVSSMVTSSKRWSPVVIRVVAFRVQLLSKCVLSSYHAVGLVRAGKTR